MTQMGLNNKASLINDIKVVLTDKTLTISQIIKEMSEHDAPQVRRIVYAMAELGVLIAPGERRAKRYRYQGD